VRNKKDNIFNHLQFAEIKTMSRTSLIIWLIFLIIVPCHIGAQLISVKTVPLASGEQFHVFPSQNFGMADVSIAVDDPLLDPFVNPAKGAIHTGSHLILLQ